MLARWVEEALVKAGARSAEAGEFTARAYFNGRLDLAEAEGGVGDEGTDQGGEFAVEDLAQFLEQALVQIDVGHFVLSAVSLSLSRSRPRVCA